MKKSVYILLISCSFLFAQTISCAQKTDKKTSPESSLSPLFLGNLNFDECDLCSGINYINDEEPLMTHTYLKSIKKVCMYAPKNIVDGDPRTAWVEGAEGRGISAEVIVPIPLDMNRPVEIWTGYGKSKSLFHANNRPKKIKISVLKEEEWRDWIDAHDMMGFSGGYGNFQRGRSTIVSLADVNGCQELAWPESSPRKHEDFPESYYRMDRQDRYIHEQAVKNESREPIKKTFWNLLIS